TLGPSMHTTAVFRYFHVSGICFNTASGKTSDSISVEIKKAEPYKQSSEERGNNGSGTLKYSMGKSRVALLSYKMSKPSRINRITINVRAGIEQEKRAKKIEILTSEIDSDDETDFISSGIFDLGDTGEAQVCTFEPVLAQYLKIKILESFGPETWPELGRVSIGVASFKIEGNIVDAASSAPLTGAEINLSGSGKTLSDGSGRFVFEDCDYGTIEITARSNGYLDAHQLIPVFAGRKVAITFKMKKHSFAVSGRVTDTETGKPVALCEVAIFPASGDAVKKPLASTVTDELGFYFFEKAQPGTVEIRALAEDYSELFQRVCIEKQKSYTINFLLKSRFANTPFTAMELSPKSGEDITNEVKIVFSHPVSENSLKNDNFAFEYHETSIEGAMAQKEPLDVESVRLDPADPLLRTVIVKVKVDGKMKKMPSLDLNIMNVSDTGKRPVAEDGVLISNYVQE
ncbi:MAG TPA: carboxypeptidase regulatory-like domain-containing protein, partial [Candidatus Wallbacteria bacterium]|nr:carboxypeptidase regulatory-like domain-containing protein [Candidatus Wallbacteria bacterium]